MPSRNGNIRKALELPRLLEPPGVETLRLGRGEVLLGLTESEKERDKVTGYLASGWDEWPEQTRTYNGLALRVVHEEDRQVLARAEGFRVFHGARDEYPVDPQLEPLILDQAAKRAAAEAVLEAAHRQLANGYMQLAKLQRKDPKADHVVVRAQVGGLKDAVQQARDAVDRESGHLTRLLTLRANRRHAVLLAESTK